MEDKQRRETERSIRSNDFLTEHHADFSDNAKAVAKIGELSEQIGRILSVHQSQLYGEKDVRRKYSIAGDAYNNLVTTMRIIRGFADSLSQEIPDFATKFRLPRTRRRLDLIDTARNFAREIEIFRAKFIEYGMDEEIFGRLETETETLAESVAAAKSSVGKRSGATTTLEREIVETNKTIKFLDPIVRHRYRNDPTNLTAWAYASRLERRRPKQRPQPAAR